jgi:hypothetical protein
MSYSFLVLQQPNTTGADVKTHRMMFGGASRFLGAVANDPTTPFQCPAAPTQSSPNTSLDFKKANTVLAPNSVSTIDALFSVQQSFIGTYMQRATDGTWQQTTGGQIGPWQVNYTPLGLETHIYFFNPDDCVLEGGIRATLAFRPDDDPDTRLAIQALSHAHLHGESLTDIPLEPTGAPFSGEYYTDGKFKIPTGETLHLVGRVDFKDSRQVPHAVAYGKLAGPCPMAFAVVGTP